MRAVLLLPPGPARGPVPTLPLDDALAATLSMHPRGKVGLGRHTRRRGVRSR
jgi:hypothetical protein